MKKKKIIIALSIFLVACISLSTLFIVKGLNSKEKEVVETSKSNNSNSKQKKDEKKETTSSKDNKDQDEDSDIQTEDIGTDVSDNTVKPNTNNNTSTNQNTSKTEIKQNTNSQSSGSNQSTSTPSNNSSGNQNNSSPQVSQPPQYVGVPDPNHYNYSFHHGVIEYSSMDACLKAVPEISFKDTSDITNAWCMDVVDGQGNVLGQYLYIKCLSGNCNKYKN